MSSFQYSTGSVSEKRVAEMIGSLSAAVAAFSVVPISSAQLKAIGTTAVTLVPASPGQVIWPLSARLFSHYGTKPYTSTGTGFLYPGNPAAYGNSSNSWGWFQLDCLTVSGNSNEGFNEGGSPNSTDLSTGKSLVLYGDGVSPSAGDGTALVYIVFRVVTP